MKNQSVYIQGAAQISVQKPLSDEWFDSPMRYHQLSVPSIDPKFSDYLPPLVSRRMCNLIKRAIITSRVALKEANIEIPEAIISGTGLGCIGNTEKFMNAIIENGEEMLPPSYFMQSTHNVLSSSIAIDLKCHSYNNTFVHRGTSFEQALYDALLMFNQSSIHNALVGGFDEMTPNYFTLLAKAGYWNKSEDGFNEEHPCFAGEVAASFALTDKATPQSLCRIEGIKILYKPSAETLQETIMHLLLNSEHTFADIELILTGINGNSKNDAVYEQMVLPLFDAKLCHTYKDIFGELFTAPALGLYALTRCYDKKAIPSYWNPNNIAFGEKGKVSLLLNHWNGTSWSIILLTRC